MVYVILLFLFHIWTSMTLAQDSMLHSGKGGDEAPFFSDS